MFWLLLITSVLSIAVLVFTVNIFLRIMEKNRRIINRQRQAIKRDLKQATVVPRIPFEGNRIQTINVFGKRGCVIDIDNTLFCTDDYTKPAPTWTLVKGQKITSVSQNRGSICGVNPDNELYCRPVGEYDQDTWIRKDGILKAVAISDITSETDTVGGVSGTGKGKSGPLPKELICGVSNDDEVYCRRDALLEPNTGVKWEPLTGANFDNLVLSDKNVCGSNRAGDTYCSTFDDKIFLYYPNANLQSIGLTDDGQICGIDIKTRGLKCGKMSHEEPDWKDLAPNSRFSGIGISGRNVVGIDHKTGELGYLPNIIPPLPKQQTDQETEQETE